MASHLEAGGVRLLTLAEVAELLGETKAAVLEDAAAGHLTWVIADGRTLYHEHVARALAARRGTADPDPLISRMQAADILGVSLSWASKLLARDPDAAGTRSYRLSAVLALKAQRDERGRTISPEHKAALHAGRDAAARLTADEVARAQQSWRERRGAS